MVVGWLADLTFGWMEQAGICPSAGSYVNVCICVPDELPVCCSDCLAEVLIQSWVADQPQTSPLPNTTEIIDSGQGSFETEFDRNNELKLIGLLICRWILFWLS